MLDALDKVERRRMCGEALERVDETMQLWERPSEVIGDLAEVHRAINEWLEAGQQREDHQIQVQALLIQLYDWLHNFLPSAAAPEEPRSRRRRTPTASLAPFRPPQTRASWTWSRLTSRCARRTWRRRLRCRLGARRSP